MGLRGHGEDTQGAAVILQCDKVTVVKKVHVVQASKRI